MLSLDLSSFFANNVGRQANMVERTLQKLSSGQRINSAADDPAGLSIADGMRAMKEGAQQAQRNIVDAVNLVKIGQDGVQGLFSIVQRMRELTVMAANSTYTDEQRQSIQNEIDDVKQLIPEAFFVAHSARISLDSKDDADRILFFQVGPNPNEMVSVDYNPLRDLLHQVVLDSFGYEELFNSKYGEMLVAAFGSPAPSPSDPVPLVGPFANLPPGSTFADAFPKKLLVNPASEENIARSLSLLDNAMDGFVGQAAYLGSVTNRLEKTLENVSAFEVNIASSESQIRDADMARELSELTKAQVIQQSSQAMMAQANQRPFQVLELLRPR